MEMFPRTHPEGSNQLVEKVVFETCKAVDTPRSLAVWLLFRYNEHNQLLALETNPSSYASADSFADDYLVSKFLSKYPGLSTGIDTKAVALDTFLSCERQCARTNTRLSRNTPTGACGAIIASMRKIISVCLAGMEADPKALIEEILLDCGWGPGVTSSVKGAHVSRFNKLAGVVELTKNLYNVGGLSMLDCCPAWKQFHSTPLTESHADEGRVTYRLTGGNTLTFVPKNAKTDRPIAVEPHLNAFLQKGIGTFIRKRLLRKFGLDLSDQSRNCELARLGSISDTLATIDLKSASDTISQSVVELLFPAEWVHLLGSCRSQKYLANGKWTNYHKWSSMGNGYTFEMETLLFYSLARAVTDYLGGDSSFVRCYGDDVILPSLGVNLFVEVASYLGFTVNQEKSFSQGPFRESCGKDYFLGVNVRPFFLREPLTHVTSAFKLANAVCRYAIQRSCFGRDLRFKKLWMTIFLATPKKYRYRIPEGIGDGGFIGSFDESTPTLSRRKSIAYQRCWYRYPYLAFMPVNVRKDGSLAVPSVLSGKDENIVSRRYRVRSNDLARILVDIGPCSSIDGSFYQLRKVGRWRPAIGFSPDWPDLGMWISTSSNT